MESDTIGDKQQEKENEVIMRKSKKRRQLERALFFRRAGKMIKEKKGVFAFYMLLRLSVILVMVAQFFNHNYENVFLCILTLVLFMMPTFIEQKLHIRFPDTMEIIILSFIYAAEILGEIHSMYIRVPMWDTMLHTLNGFLVAAIGFCLVDLLNRNDNFQLKLSPLYLAIVAFCFSMTIGVLWEFFEFGMDNCFRTDMQKDTVLTSFSTVTLDPQGLNNPVIVDGIETVTINDEKLPVEGYLDIGLYDTMEDLFVNFLGAIVFSIIGFFYVKSKGKSGIAKRFIPEVYQFEPPKE